MEKVICWLAPAASENGGAGEDVAPSGTPASAIVTEPVNSFCPATATVTAGLGVPSTTDREAGDTETLKSPTCGGGEPLPPPHAVRNRKQARTHGAARSPRFLPRLLTYIPPCAISITAVFPCPPRCGVSLLIPMKPS